MEQGKKKVARSGSTPTGPKQIAEATRSARNAEANGHRIPHPLLLRKSLYITRIVGSYREFARRTLKIFSAVKRSSVFNRLASVPNIRPVSYRVGQRRRICHPVGSLSMSKTFDLNAVLSSFLGHDDEEETLYHYTDQAGFAGM